MTPDERCLTRACEAFIGRQGDHEFGELVAAAVALRAARHRPAAVEAWEDGPCGVGMSDKAVGVEAPRCNGFLRSQGLPCPMTCARCGLGPCRVLDAQLRSASHPPAAEEPTGRAAEAQDGRGALAGAVGAVAAKFIRCACGALYEPSNSHECDAGRFRRAINPAPIAPERGERRPLPVTEADHD